MNWLQEFSQSGHAIDVGLFGFGLQNNDDTALGVCANSLEVR